MTGRAFAVTAAAAITTLLAVLAAWMWIARANRRLDATDTTAAYVGAARRIIAESRTITASRRRDLP